MSDAAPSARRTTFYEELTRRRRAGWIAAVVCALIAAGVGLVLSTIVTPLVLLILGGLLKLVGGFGVATIQAFVAGQIANFDHLSAVLDRVQGLGDLGLLVGPLLRFAPVAVPALITALLVWLWLRALFGRVGSDAFVARLGARPARPDDFEERQLANIVEEVAIGAGAPVPQLFLIDSAQVNAAALGTSHRNGVLLFTRGLLETLDRSETEAVAARLISTIGAGDLRAAAGVTAVLRTLGFFLTLLDLPLRGGAWRTLGDLLRVSVTPRPGIDALGRVGDGLEEGLQAEALPDLDRLASGAPPIVGKVLRFAILPFYLASALYKLVLFLWTSLCLGPPLALLWRNRCYWTDARVVQLARNPEAFAKALEKIGAVDPPPGGEAFAYLFIAAPTAARRSASDRRTLALALTPSTSDRLARLAAMGAEARPSGAFDFKAFAAARPGSAAIVGALGLLLVPLFAVLFAAIGFLTAIVTSIGLLTGLMIVHTLI